VEKRAAKPEEGMSRPQFAVFAFFGLLILAFVLLGAWRGARMTESPAKQEPEAVKEEPKAVQAEAVAPQAPAVEAAPVAPPANELEHAPEPARAAEAPSPETPQGEEHPEEHREAA
jgi:hypothetical protein